MAARNSRTTASKAEDIVEEGDVSSAPSDWEWESLTSETATRVVFDTIGDTFVGQFLYEEHIAPEGAEEKDEFDLYVFKGRDGNLYAVNKSWKIEQGMLSVAENDWVRMRYVKDVETKKGLNPMKDIVIDVRRG